MYSTGRFQLVRGVMQRWYQLRRRPVPAHHHHHHRVSSSLQTLDAAHLARNIERDGYAEGLRLEPETLHALRDFASGSTCYGAEKQEFPFELHDRAGAEARYGRKLSVGRLDQALDECPTLQRLVRDPQLLALASNYLGAEPVLLGARIWWSFATASDAAQQMQNGQGFHYDLDGYKALAFFFYLTDVTRQHGAHVCVRGSHREKPLRSLLSLYKGRSEADIERWYGGDRQVTLCGEAGSGFAEDIFCFHKGLHPVAGSRLLLQIRFGLCRYSHAPE